MYIKWNQEENKSKGPFGRHLKLVRDLYSSIYVHIIYCVEAELLKNNPTQLMNRIEIVKARYTLKKLKIKRSQFIMMV